MGSSDIQGRLATRILLQRTQPQIHKHREQAFNLIRIAYPLLPPRDSMQQRVSVMVDLVNVVLGKYLLVIFRVWWALGSTFVIITARISLGGAHIREDAHPAARKRS